VSAPAKYSTWPIQSVVAADEYVPPSDSSTSLTAASVSAWVPQYRPELDAAPWLIKTFIHASGGMAPLSAHSWSPLMPASAAAVSERSSAQCQVTLKGVTCVGAANVSNSSSDTTPNDEPAPRTAKRSSGWHDSDAWTVVPLARVTVAPRIQSMVRPLRCDDVPQPPWVACPPTPTPGQLPCDRPRPASLRATATSPRRAPVPTLATPSSPTDTASKLDMSTTRWPFSPPRPELT
jgi:hypothetical protein